MNTPAPSPKKSFFVRLQLRLAQARFLTFSALLHVVLVVIGGSVVLIKQVVDAPDFEPEGKVQQRGEGEEPRLREPQLQPDEERFFGGWSGSVHRWMR